MKLLSTLLLTLCLLTGLSWASPPPDYPIFNPPETFNLLNGNQWHEANFDSYLEMGDVIVLTLEDRVYVLIKMNGALYWYDIESKESYKWVPPARWRRR